MNCLRCGQCCLSASLVLDNVSVSDDVRELGKWLALHHCQPEAIQGKLGVRIPLICTWLVFDENTGMAICKDYDKRPAICREYLCKRSLIEGLKNCGVSV